MRPPPPIEVGSLTVRFDGRSILDRFSLYVDPGEKVLVTGRSGCGKSTLLRSILGFVAPDEGTIHIEGGLLTAENVWKLRTRLAYVAQEPDLGTGSVQEVLQRPFRYQANKHLAGNLDGAGELAERFLLAPELLGKDVATLSVGEKQRVALISAILLGRGILLLDEPTSALDKTSRKAVSDYLQSCEDVAVLFAAHDEGAFAFAHRIIHLSDGMSRRSE